MNSGLFITGATGFVGRTLLDLLHPADYKRIVCLARVRPSVCPSGLQFVEGDLVQRASYQAALEGISTVVHLAAATGKVPRAQFLRTNVDGTSALLTACKQQGVQNILYVSTIAARFRDQEHYPYAQSKAAAEKLVAASGLAYTIVRPTIVLGKGSPVLKGLKGLANAPVIPVFGSGKVAVQPVAVEDLAAALLRIVETARFRNESLEVGGPEVLTIEQLLQRIRKVSKGHRGTVIHLPVNLIRTCLAAVETYLTESLPLTAGQLASFVNDGVAEPNAFTTLQPSLIPLDKTLRAAL